MPRSRIDVGGAIDTWIRELPNLGRARDMHDDWAQATHLMLEAARGHTHVDTGQLRATSYSTTQARGAWQIEGRILWPARNPDTGYHYAQQEFGLPNIQRFRRHAGTDHDAPALAFAEAYPAFIEAIGSGLERQVRGWA
ncbi:hypothetical protein [Actinomycetospora termitidis]|uniref:HK97 gp10 family phage protein n=1 Tax=Actinomycetospora termitidis TaxID=3053470 RepID=A0ABT7MFG8_9PSEU|nr:hypothetical protein [Actinomycetospora sp. Odt1-22]MDL5159409.1 hypothetical protein [Actinomycetospora sp. Odt1-22]